MLDTNRTSVESVKSSDINSVKYHPLNEDELWKVNLVHELNDLKYGKLELDNFSDEEIEEMISFACTS